MDRLLQAENPNTQKRILEVFAKDLPISNRYVFSVIPRIAVILRISVIKCQKDNKILILNSNSISEQ